MQHLASFIGPSKAGPENWIHACAKNPSVALVRIAGSSVSPVIHSLPSGRQAPLSSLADTRDALAIIE
jgi:hypothetical protein